MDALCELCFMEAIKTEIKDEDLPMDASGAFNRMAASRPENTYIDVKKSTYKKLSKFVKEMAKKKYIKTKEVQDTLQIVSINREHPHYKQHQMTGPKAVDTQEPPANSAVHTKAKPATMQIVELYKSPANLVILFAKGDAVPSKDVLYTADQVKNAIVDYAVAHKLVPVAKQAANNNAQQQQGQQPLQVNHIKLNEFLLTNFYKKSDNINPNQAQSVTSVLAKVLDKMVDHYALVTSETSDPVIKKGKLDCIQIASENVRGNKNMTKVVGFEHFGIDFWNDEFLKEVRTKMSASVTTRKPEEKSNMAESPDMSVQGNCCAELSQLLQDYFGIPKKYIETEDKTKKKKKK